MGHRRAELRVDVMHMDVFLFLRHLVQLEYFLGVAVVVFCHLNLCYVHCWERPRRVVLSWKDVSSQRSCDHFETILFVLAVVMLALRGIRGMSVRRSYVLRASDGCTRLTHTL